MELRRYFSLVRKWGWLILIIVGLAAVGSYLYSLTIPPTYRTEAVLLVGQEQQSVNPTANDLYVQNNIAQAYALLASQPSVLQATADAIKWSGPWQSLYFNINATAPANGQTIHISATGRTPQQAQAISNEVAHQVILQSPVSQQQQASDAQRSFITDQQGLLQAQIVASQKALTSLNQQAALETDDTKLADLDSRITALQTKIDSSQRTYLEMGTLLNQSSGRYITLIAPATLPTSAVSPNIPQNVLLAAAASLVFAVALVLLLEYLDDTIKSADDVQRVMELSTLGSIARIQPLHKPEDALITVRHPRSPTAEDYRILRTNLRYSGIENPGSALLVTSANPGEGKTTTAANLAIAMAQAGKRVVLVDADMRRPGVHRLFGLPNQVGLSSLFLEDGLTLNQVLLETPVHGLRVLTSGDPPPNPAEILESRRMNDLLQQLRSESDMVVVDSPPLLVVADANIIASRCSGALLVIDSGHTRTEAGRRVTASLKHSKVKLMGVVLNRMTSRRGLYYNNYYYYSSKTKPTPGNKRGSAAPQPANGSDSRNGHTNGNGKTGETSPTPQTDQSDKSV